jgi:hypothetical protein
VKINIESTTKIVHLNGVPARVWEGKTESGVKIHCFITRVAIDKDEQRAEEFEKELQEQRVPSPEIEAFPMRMII